MSFWDLSDNSSAAQTGTDYEIPGGNLDPIPAGSSVLAMPDQVQWRETPPEKGPVARYIEIRWNVIQPKQYENRKIFHKLWVTDFDPNAKDQRKATEKRDKARRMLAAIDANAGGKLTQSPGVPDDNAIGMALVNKPMVITLMEWESNQGGGGGNWVSAVAPKSKPTEIKPAKAKPAQSGGYSGGYGGGRDDFGQSQTQAGGYGGGNNDPDFIPF